MEYVTRTFWTDRLFSHEGARIVLHYGLCCERTPNGNDYHYLKIHQETWRDSELIAEDLQVVGGFGRNLDQVTSLYEKICASSDPVFPIHLMDLVHDALLSCPSAHPDAGVPDEQASDAVFLEQI